MIPAVAAAERGWAVFPCRPGDKRPAVPDWENRACADPERVARYWPSPRHNYGIACGPSALVVIDLDAHGGELPGEWQLPGINDGRDVFYQICEWAGMDWPSTYWVATPSGGWHLYFRAPGNADFRNSAGLLGPMVDVRAAGGYVVGAGSSVNGRAYEVIDDRLALELPRWLARVLLPEEAPVARPAARRAAGAGAGPGRIAALIRTVEQARPGNRNNALFWAACHMAEESPGDLSQLAAAAEATGLGSREIAQTIRSAQRTVTR